MKVDLVDITDIHLTQKEYDKLYQLFIAAKRIIRTTFDTNQSFSEKLSKAKDRYEKYRISLSDKYIFELLRFDGSYFACDGLRVVYVKDIFIKDKDIHPI